MNDRWRDVWLSEYLDVLDRPKRMARPMPTIPPDDVRRDMLLVLGAALFLIAIALIAGAMPTYTGPVR